MVTLAINDDEIVRMLAGDVQSAPPTVDVQLPMRGNRPAFRDVTLGHGPVAAPHTERQERAWGLAEIDVDMRDGMVDGRSVMLDDRRLAARAGHGGSGLELFRNRCGCDDGRD